MSEALKLRRTAREIASRPLTKDGPFGPVGRTAASASNSQEIGIYVAQRDGELAIGRKSCAEKKQESATDDRAAAEAESDEGLEHR